MDNTRGRRDDREHDEAEAVFRVMLRPIASSLPFPGRRGRARSSREGTFAHPVHPVHPAEQAAGVRRHL